MVNKHEWEMFVKLADKNLDANRVIEKVRFGLHETFGVEYQDVKANPSGKFEMKFIGWGTFIIPVTITFRLDTGLSHRKKVIKLEDHMLSFEGNGKWKSVLI